MEFISPFYAPSLIYLGKKWFFNCVLPEDDPVDEAEVREPVRQVPEVQHVLFQPLLGRGATKEF